MRVYEKQTLELHPDILNQLDTVQHRDAIDLLRSLPDESVDLVFTDPPYNISQKNTIYRDYRNDTVGNISFDFGEWDYGFNPIEFLEETKRVLHPTGSLVVFTSEQLYGTYRGWCFENMFPKGTLFWIKTNPLPGFRKVSYRQSTEMIFWASKSQTISYTNPNFNFLSQEEMKNVIYAPICGGRERLKNPKHPTQKPLSICTHVLRVHCRPGGVVVDPFTGVGSIPVAAKRLGIHYIASELNKEFVVAAETRLESV